MLQTVGIAVLYLNAPEFNVKSVSVVIQTPDGESVLGNLSDLHARHLMSGDLEGHILVLTVSESKYIRFLPSMKDYGLRDI